MLQNSLTFWPKRSTIAEAKHVGQAGIAIIPSTVNKRLELEFHPQSEPAWPLRVSAVFSIGRNWEMSDTKEIPYGYCHCGCGRKTSLAKQSSARDGHVKGEPVRFCSGHNGQKITIPEMSFWAKVQKTDECWLWMGGKDSWGYGALKVGGVQVKASRYSYELHNGPIPAGLCVLHKCDVPACVNPVHLFLGTDKDNAVDRENKGRGGDHSKEKNGMAKLAESSIRGIFKDSKRGLTQREIADKHGISQGQVSRILNGKRWSSLC